MATCLVINTFHDVVLFKCPTLFLHLLAFSMFSPMSDQIIPWKRSNYPPMEKKLSPDGEKTIPRWRKNYPPVPFFRIGGEFIPLIRAHNPAVQAKVQAK